MKLPRTEEEIAFARAQGRRLYDLRQRRGLSRPQLQLASGVNCWTLYRIEMGDSTASAFQIDALAAALNAPREQFFPTTRMPARVIGEPRRAYAC